MQFVGIDVSAKTLVVCLQPPTPKTTPQQLTFDNTWEGHQKLCRRLTKSRRPTRVVLEATGLYSLDIALALVQQPGVEVMVVNPRSLRDFARADLRRSKTDAVDARYCSSTSSACGFSPGSLPARKAWSCGLSAAVSRI